jgi:CheB methylesterase
VNLAIGALLAQERGPNAIGIILSGSGSDGAKGIQESQHVPGSIINPGGRWTGMACDPLRDLDGAAQIHVLGNRRPLFEDKAKGQKRQAPRPSLTRSNVIDLVAALQESVAQKKPRKRGAA